MFSTRDCGGIRPLLWEWAEEKLGEADRVRVEEHLVRCASCEREAERVQRAVQGLTALAAVPIAVPPGDFRQVAARLEKTSRPPTVNPIRSLKPVFAALGAAAFCGFGALVTPLLVSASADRAAPATPTAPVFVPATPDETLQGSAAPLDPFPPSERAPLQLRVTPCFGSNYSVPNSMVPLLAFVKNRGKEKSAQIVVTMRGSFGSRYVRSVQLSGGGAVQRFFLYPPNFGAYVVDIELRAQDGAVLKEAVGLGSSGDAIQIVGIGDNFRNANGNPNSRLPNSQTQNLSVVPSWPEAAPDRAVGYSGVRLLALGPGAERMNVAQWQAIREWVATGGKLLLFPGDYLKMGEAAALSPAKRIAAAEMDRIGKIQVTVYRAGLQLAKDADVSPAVPANGGWVLGGGTAFPNSASILLKRRVGFGESYYVGVDLKSFQAQRDQFGEGKDALPSWAKLITLTNSQHDRNLTLAAGGWMDSGHYEDGNRQNPFTIPLPDVSSVQLILIGYFLLVVPGTFLVLRRLRRLNLAWVTGPTLAVLFAGGMFFFRSDLYRAPLSRRTVGRILVTPGDNSAQFVGNTELFFPHGGSYAVRIPGASRMHSEGSEYDGYGNRRSSSTLEVVDDGHAVSVPDLSVGNLAFRRIQHQQPVNLGGTITVQIRAKSDGRYDVTVRNKTRLTLNHISLPLGITSTKPDQNHITHTLWKRILLPDSLAPDTTRTWRSVAVQSGRQPVFADPRVTLMATADSAEFGPRIGTEIGGQVNVLVANSNTNEGGVR